MPSAATRTDDRSCSGLVPFAQRAGVIAMLVVLVFSFSGRVSADTLEEFRVRQDKVREVLEKAMPATVAITSRRPGGTGSGVIISSAGLILTAAHVTEATGEDLTIIFPDGRKVDGKALGANKTLDAGLARITSAPDTNDGWPHCKLGASDALRMGVWCVALGHPGGYQADRQPPLRIGRIWHRDQYGALYTDCTLIGGDSGGPLFDLDGQVVGIHSSIGGSLSTNRHVGVDSFRIHWDRMLNGDIWGKLHLNPDDGELATIGVELDWSSREGALVRAVRNNAPAADAGILKGDMIVQFAGEPIDSSIRLLRKLAEMKAGDLASVSVKRLDEFVDLEVVLTDYKSLTQPPSLESQPVDDVPYLGVEVDGVPEEKGALITEVVEASPAAEAGLRVGDIIVGIDEESVDSPAELVERILQRLPEDSLSLSVLRNGATETLNCKLGRQ